MADSIFAAIRDALAAATLTAGLEATQGMGKPRPAAIYAVGKLSGWAQSYQSSTSTWYDARVELRFHAPTPEAAESAASLAESVLAPLPLDWSVGGSGPPLSLKRRGEQVKGHVAGANFQAVHCLELTYKATGMPGALSADITTASAFNVGGYDTFPYPA